MVKIVCIIPARGGSKGVPRKNLRKLGGKPLIQWTIEEAQKSNYIEQIIISTEDKEIEEVSIQLGTKVIKRPEILASDDSPTIDSILFTLHALKNMYSYTPDYVLLLQCTSPFRKAAHIDSAIELLLYEDKKADSLISVTKEEHPPWWIKSINTNGMLEDFISYDKEQFSRRQSFPPVYRLNGAIYFGKVHDIYKYKSFETDKTLAFIMDRYSSLDIDNEEDFKWAEYTSSKNI